MSNNSKKNWGSTIFMNFKLKIPCNRLYLLKLKSAGLLESVFCFHKMWSKSNEKSHDLNANDMFSTKHLCVDVTLDRFFFLCNYEMEIDYLLFTCLQRFCAWRWFLIFHHRKITPHFIWPHLARNISLHSYW